MKNSETTEPIVSEVLSSTDASRERLFGAALYGPIGPDRRAIRGQWLVRLRWVAITGQLAVVYPALQTGWLAPEHLYVYLGVVGTLLAFNFACIFKICWIILLHIFPLIIMMIRTPYAR